MGGLLVVSRLLAEPAAGERLEPVERRLFGSFIHGGAALVIASGILLILDQPSVLRQGWLHAKLLVVLGLVAADARLYRRMQAQHASPGSVLLQRRGVPRLAGRGDGDGCKRQARFFSGTRAAGRPLRAGRPAARPVLCGVSPRGRARA